MREAERYTLLAKAAEELRDKEERLRERIMLSHVAREWRGDLYVRRLREDARGEYALEMSEKRDWALCGPKPGRPRRRAIPDFGRYGPWSGRKSTPGMAWPAGTMSVRDGRPPSS
jgi:hypothetical protein